MLLGEHNKESKADDEQGLSLPTRYDIIERINHPDYREPSVYNDIALYRLHEDVQFNEYVRPICLQTDHQFAKTYAIATGWGRTEWGKYTYSTYYPHSHAIQIGYSRRTPSPPAGAAPSGSS